MPLLRAVSDLMGPTLKTFEASLADYLHVDPPDWMRGSAGDELADTYPVQDRLRRDGLVIWAAVVQANRLAFQPGPWDHACSVVWSEDPHCAARPVDLFNIGARLGQLKGTDPSDPDAATVARVLTNERTRAPRLPVALRFTGGRPVFHSSLMLVRKHLPKGLMRRNLLPVWSDPNPTGLLLPVPAAYCPASLTAWWPDDDGPMPRFA